jgi:hypothetical protein
MRLPRGISARAITRSRSPSRRAISICSDRIGAPVVRGSFLSRQGLARPSPWIPLCRRGDLPVIRSAFRAWVHLPGGVGHTAAFVQEAEAMLVIGWDIALSRPSNLQISCPDVMMAPYLKLF